MPKSKRVKSALGVVEKRLREPSETACLQLGYGTDSHGRKKLKDEGCFASKCDNYQAFKIWFHSAAAAESGRRIYPALHDTGDQVLPAIGCRRQRHRVEGVYRTTLVYREALPSRTLPEKEAAHEARTTCSSARGACEGHSLTHEDAYSAWQQHLHFHRLYVEWRQRPLHTP